MNGLNTLSTNWHPNQYLFREGKTMKPAKNVFRNHLLQCESKSEYPPREVSVIDAGDLVFHTS